MALKFKNEKEFREWLAQNPQISLTTSNDSEVKSEPDVGKSHGSPTSTASTPRQAGRSTRVDSWSGRMRERMEQDEAVERPATESVGGKPSSVQEQVAILDEIGFRGGCLILFVYGGMGLIVLLVVIGILAAIS